MGNSWQNTSDVSWRGQTKVSDNFLTLHTHFVSTQGSFQGPWSLFWSNFPPPFDIPSYLTTLLSSSFLPFLHIPLPAGSSTAPSFISRSTIKRWSQACLQHIMLLYIPRVIRTVSIFPSSEWRLVWREMQGEDWHLPICICSTAQHGTPREVISEELEAVERNQEINCCHYAVRILIPASEN